MSSRKVWRDGAREAFVTMGKMPNGATLVAARALEDVRTELYQLLLELAGDRDAEEIELLTQELREARELTAWGAP